MKTIAALATAILSLTVLVAGCGVPGSSSPQHTAAGSPPARTVTPRRFPPITEYQPHGSVTITVANSKYGPVLVDSRGRTVYMLAGDRGHTSTCYDACPHTWPPVETQGKPHAADGANARYLDTIQRRDDDTTQVTYRSHPLYYYEGDTRPGETLGQQRDMFGQWHVLTPTGKPIDAPARR